MASREEARPRRIHAVYLDSRQQADRDIPVRVSIHRNRIPPAVIPNDGQI